MAIFDKLTALGTEAAQSAKKAQDKFNIPGFSATPNVKKELEEKNQERAKIYGYIGMEACDMYRQGKLEIPELSIYFDKMQELDKAIVELEEEKKKIEQKAQNSGKVICSCGCAVSPKNRFCPQCGKPIEQRENVCVCGKKIKGDVVFCPNCGRNVKSAPAETTAPPQANAVIQNYRECICGAKVPEGQFMCMECGRKIE